MLGLLFERYHRMLFTFFYRIHHSSEISEDLVQNVFIRILKYRRGFQGEGTFKVWMFHIARNVSNDQFKQEKRSGRSEDISDWDDRMTDHDEITMKESRNEQLGLLSKAMDQLEPEKRELIVMSKLDGLKYRDIAEFYNVTEGNVKIRVFRALKELKSAYAIVEQRLNQGA